MTNSNRAWAVFDPQGRIKSYSFTTDSEAQSVFQFLTYFLDGGNELEFWEQAQKEGYKCKELELRVIDETVDPFKDAKYDEIYFKGMEWLDEQ